MEFLNDTNIVVLIAFLIFVGGLVYLGVPKMVTKMLDDRADKIRSELDEARSLREEAQTLLASFERKQVEAKEQADSIVAQAKEEAKMALAQGKEDLAVTIERRVQAATDQIASAEASAVKEIKDKAVTIAVAAASEVISGKMTTKDKGSLIDDAIKEVADKLH